MLRSLLLLFFLALIHLFPAASAAAAVMGSVDERPVGFPIPDDFLVEVLTDGGATYSSIAFIPGGGLFVAEKGGRIWSWSNITSSLSLQIDLQEEVYENGMQGIASMVVEEYQGGARLFILYSVSELDDDEDGEAFGRVARYDLSPDTYSIVENSKAILLGDDFSNGIPACNGARSLGKIRLGQDGSLLIATSDAASDNEVDVGGLHAECFGAGRFGNEEDIGAYRSQSLTSLAGKVLRIDTSTGNGLPSNPFFSGLGTNTTSKIWSYGLREPAEVLALELDNGSDYPGHILIADRGWSVLEELNSSSVGGGNYGWPCLDGLEPAAQYANGPLGSVFCDTDENLAPQHWWHHQNSAFSNPSGLAGTRLGSLAQYKGDAYPEYYKGRIFYSDQNRGWLATAAQGPDGRLQDQALFSIQTGTVLDLQYNPYDHYLYFIDQGTGTLARLRHQQEANVVALDGNPRIVEVAGWGMYGEYFDEVDFTGDSVIRIDTLLAYDVFDGPEGDIYNAARWEGFVVPEHSEVYTLHVSYLESIRFWMNDELLFEDDGLDDGRELRDRVIRQFVKLKAGVPYRIKVEQALEEDEVKIGLAWSSASQELESLSENEVFYSIREGVNLCLLEGASTSLSSTLSPFAIAANACDGNTNGDFFAGSVAVTESQQLPYWDVDLGSVRDVGQISLWGRTDCCEESLIGAFIFVSNTPFLEDDLGVLSQEGVSAYIVNGLDNARFSVPVNRTARYIRIQHPIEPVLHLAEAEIQAGLGNLEGAPPPEGLVSWWPFERGGEDRRSFNDGVLRNGARTTEDESRQNVLALDGFSDWMEVPHSDRLNGTQGLSYALWIWPEEWKDEIELMAKYSGEEGQMWLGVEDGFLVGRALTEAGDKEVRTVLPTERAWSHVALTYDGNNLGLYVNGLEEMRTSFAFSPLRLNEAPLEVGKDFYGRLDDAVVYNIALDDQQLQELIGALSNVQVDDEGPELPATTVLAWESIFPNPFYDSVNVNYVLSHGHVVSVDVYDSIGRRIRSFQADYKPRGDQAVIWNGRSDTGDEVRAGVYFIRVVANGTVITSPLIKL
ncbi:MAG: PQQ-dependent sugar dehydrogenase [Rhodothermaceae bacterium]|nr:PQQ-dependent sugar dehydrogenase [Rhodothermaceae bacterium]